MKKITQNPTEFKTPDADCGDLWDRLMAEAAGLAARCLRERSDAVAWRGAHAAAHGVANLFTRRAADEAAQRIPASRMADTLAHMRAVASAHGSPHPVTHDLPGTGAGLRFTVAVVDGAPRVTRVFHARR